MAGLKKEGSTWFASYYVAGKQLVKTTGIPIVPAAIPPGKTKAAMMKQNEASARLIAQELEKAVYGQQVDAALIKALAGEKKGRQLLRGKQYMQGVKDYLNEWLLTEKSTVNNGNKAVSLFCLFSGRFSKHAVRYGDAPACKRLYEPGIKTR